MNDSGSDGKYKCCALNTAVSIRRYGRLRLILARENTDPRLKRAQEDQKHRNFQILVIFFACRRVLQRQGRFRAILDGNAWTTHRSERFRLRSMNPYSISTIDYHLMRIEGKKLTASKLEFARTHTMAMEINKLYTGRTGFSSGLRIHNQFQQ
jgi:hypothetical protein